MRKWLAGIAALGLLLVSTACGGGHGAGGASAGSPASGRAAGGELVIATQSDGTTLDPHEGPAMADALNIWPRVYDTLTTMGDHLKVEPGVAESWTQRLPKVWLFNIRQGVRFSNGREMTVDDVVGSLRRMLKMNQTPATHMGRVASVAKSGPWEVKITLKEPNPALPAGLAAVSNVLPMKELDAGTFDPKKELLGTGPFRVVSHRKDESWTFERNPYYWRPGLPKAGRLVIKFIPDDSARIAALRSGSVDIADFNRPDAARLLQGVPNVKTVAQARTDYNVLYVNARRSLFADGKLREALALATDREEMAKALGGAARPTAASPVAFGVCDPAATPYGKPDRDAARKLVESAGATGKPVSILIAGDPPQKAIAQVLEQNLRAIGLKPRIEQGDLGNAVKRVYTAPGNFDLYPGWMAGLADPATVVKWWGPERYDWSQHFYAADGDLDSLLARTLSEPAGQQRDTDIRAACAKIAKLANMIPLTTRPVVVGYRTDRVDAKIDAVEGWTVTLRHLEEDRPLR